ncbi:rhamnogalacturonan acetylesterase [uncultured Bacteroides sp.]|uniref:rhamnogalacturonan acetylesterase n=1 Tax=uncultured Bacteroides sp. TaxID=162156 RepID=UPI002AAC1881|nr:rhamnogalacturonan acetylesterase [uncultured Bacteroides sp.]
MKKILLLILIPFLLSFQSSDKIRVYIAGDSTAQTYDTTKTLQRGWGQMLPSFFDDKVEVINKAKAGRSTKSFQDEGRWTEIVSDIRKGDWVIIQFGHNDTSDKPERHASPEDYRKNLIKFITDVRRKKANPILLTSVVMRTFKDGALVDDRLKVYPGITREVAKEYNVPMIDINLKTRDLILKLGDEKSKSLYMWLEPGVDPSKPDGSKDDTHSLEAGAKQIAKYVAEGIKELKLNGIYKHIK